MLVVEGINAMRRARWDLEGTVGFVPTMGFLHAGHLSLIELARKQNDHVAVSIFVNPTQFGAGEDFAAYPRDLNRDLAMLDAAGVDLVFTPRADAMFPEGFETWVEPGPIADRLEGLARPGHFRGVNTVVLKLFNIVLPERAYFGQKDAQQVAVIKSMVRDLNVPIEIVVGPTLREPDGLAMSSRNTYLTAYERNVAPIIYRSLQAAQNAWRSGEQNPSALRDIVRKAIALNKDVDLDYVAVSHGQSLEDVQIAAEGDIISLAARLGRARLIDNIVLTME
jgi:pantoate--beta-alanine ligase